MSTAIERRRLETSAVGPAVTALDLDGGASGPTLVVLGGIHGDEPQGVRGALETARRLQRLDFRGRVRIVPISHEAAFEAASRVSPRDGLNLAREFPGDGRGTATQRLAALIDSAVVADAEILVDMHSAGLHYAMPTLVGYPDDGSAAGREAARLAEAAGLPVVWRHPGPLPTGRSGTGPHARGVPFLYLESTDDRDEAPTYADALLRVMAASGMLDEAPSASGPGPTRLVGSGDLDVGGVVADRSGLIALDVDVLEHVVRGQDVARITDPRAGTTTVLKAHTDGVVVMRRRTGWLAEGDLVVFLTDTEEATP